MLSRLLRSVGEFRTDRWRPGFAMLLALGTAIPIVLGIWWHEPLLGVLGSIGALYTGLTSFGNIYGARLRQMALTAVSVAFLSVLGSLTHPSDLASIVSVGLVGFLFALLGSMSPANSLGGLLGTGIFIVLSGLEPARQGPLAVGGAILAGGVLETLLVAVIGSLFSVAAERSAVASAYESLGLYIRSFSKTGAIRAPDALAFRDAHACLDEAIAQQEKDEHAHLSHVLEVGETLRAGLIGLTRAIAGSKEEEASRRILATLQHDFRDFAEAIRSGRTNVLASLAGRPIMTGDEEIDHWVRLTVLSLEEIARPPLPESLERPKRAASPWLNRRRLRSGMTHAIRFGLALAVGTAVYRLGHIPMGYWIPLTITFLLRPDYASTLVKGFGRFMGTLAGVVLTSVCVVALPHDPWLLAGLAILSGWLMFALFEVSFALYIAALTFYVIIGIAGLGHAEVMVGVERTIATLGGAVLALLATFLWPAWQSTNLKSVFHNAFLAQVEFGESLDRFPYEDERHPEILRNAARAQRIEAERLVEATRLEPQWSRRTPLEDAEGWMAKLAANAAVLLSLHALALEIRAGRVEERAETREMLQRAISEARLMAAQLT